MPWPSPAISIPAYASIGRWLTLPAAHLLAHMGGGLASTHSVTMRQQLAAQLAHVAKL